MQHRVRAGHFTTSRPFAANPEVYAGINLSFARLLASKGANVVAADLQETEALKELMKNSRSVPPDHSTASSSSPKLCSSSKVLYKKTDVTDWKSLAELFEFSKKELGAVDLLCNGAGVFEPVSQLLSKPTNL